MDKMEYGHFNIYLHIHGCRLSLMDGTPDATVCSYVTDSLLNYTISHICPLFYCLYF
jgi:hypothetical protein